MQKVNHRWSVTTSDLVKTLDLLLSPSGLALKVDSLRSHCTTGTGTLKIEAPTFGMRLSISVEIIRPLISPTGVPAVQLVARNRKEVLSEILRVSQLTRMENMHAAHDAVRAIESKTGKIPKMA